MPELRLDKVTNMKANQTNALPLVRLRARGNKMLGGAFTPCAALMFGFEFVWEVVCVLLHGSSVVVEFCTQ